MESRGTGQTRLVGCTEDSCQPAYRRRALYRLKEEPRRIRRRERDETGWVSVASKRREE